MSFDELVNEKNTRRKASMANVTCKKAQKCERLWCPGRNADNIVYLEGRI